MNQFYKNLALWLVISLMMILLFNLFNKQTGYDIEPRVHNSAFGTPRTYYDPRRLQLAARFQF